MKKTLTQQVEAILERFRPYIRSHKGDVILERVKSHTVVLRITGTCAHCKLARLTYNNIVSGFIRAEIPEIRKVVIKT